MFNLKVITPQGEYLNAEALSITLSSVDGKRTVLPNHMPLVLPLAMGSFKLRTKEGVHEYFSEAGIFTIEHNQARLITSVVERDDEIDIKRAQRAKKRAEERLSAYQETNDLVRAEAALKRALTRLRIKE